MSVPSKNKLLQRLLGNRSQRSTSLIVNVIASFFIKGWSGIIQILMVPVTLACLDTYEYGIWMVLSSMLVWIDSFDIGLGNGLRNKLTTYIAYNQKEEAQQAVSTCFFSLVVLMALVSVVLLLLESYVDLNEMLKVDSSRIPNLTQIVQVATLIVCVTFIFKSVGNVLLALQLPAVNNMLLTLGSMCALIAIWVCLRMGVNVTLFLIATIFTLSTLLVFVLAFPIVFCIFYPYLRPKLRMFRWKMLNGIFTLGIKFFILQIFGLILFATSNVIISHILGPESVTPYQISQKYFNFLFVLFTILVVPLWSATTDAYAKGDFAWIDRCSSRGLRIMCLMGGILILMALISQWIYPVWTLGKVEVPPLLTWMMAIYMFVTMFSLFYAHLLFGIGKVQVQMWVTIGEAIAFIPLAIYGAQTWGIVGVLGALTLVNMACAITNCAQVRMICQGKATGIWDK